MQKLTEAEVDKEIDEGTGFFSFMGGTCSKNGKVVVIVNDGSYLFLNNEVGDNNYLKLMKQQNIESEEYTNFLIE